MVIFLMAFSYIGSPASLKPVNTSGSASSGNTVSTSASRSIRPFSRSWRMAMEVMSFVEEAIHITLSGVMGLWNRGEAGSSD